MALAGLLLVSFGSALAVVHRWEWVRHPAQVVAPEPSAASSKHKRADVPALALEPPAVAEPIADAQFSSSAGPRAGALRAPLREIRATAPVPTLAAPATITETAAPPSDDALTVETSMIDQALAALGQRRPQDALAAVDAYRQRFPRGKLEYEADLAEVKAQVALGKDAPALAVLDRAIAIHGFDTLPRSPDLSLLRAELLSRTGDCAGAIPVFSRLLEGEHPEPGFQERAVYGRAICLGKLGQRGESRRALRDYLNRFPDGRFVKAAQDALDPLE
jgi:TolA-binding protein